MRTDNLTICVTGGLGYIGSHTAKSLRKAGARVIVVDRREVPQNRVEGTEYIKGDFSNPLVLSRLKDMRVDGFVHCAGSSLVGPSLADPSEYYDNNVAKMITFLDHLSTWTLKPFIVFSSSASVYGEPKTTPIKEEAIKDPINPYGNTKMMVERIINDYANAYGFRYFIYRYFNACGADVWNNQLGPEGGDSHILPKMFEAYQQKRSFHLYGTNYNTPDGTCVRDYIHVCDLALAHLLACVELSGTSGSKVYNLGTGKGYSNQELIDAFIDEVGTVDIQVEDRRGGDPDELVADVSKIQSELGWTAKYSDIETIIGSMQKFYQNVS